MGIYENNLAVLERKFPEIFDWISTAAEDPRLRFIRTPKGFSNALWREESGTFRPLYHSDDPVEEERERLKNLQCPSEMNLFVIGIGLGYFLPAMKEKIRKGQKIVILEKNATLLQMSLKQVNMTPLLENNILHFCLPDDGTIRECISQNTLGVTKNVTTISGCPGIVESQREYSELQDLVIKEMIKNTSLNQTTIQHGELYATNQILNLPKYILSPGIKNFFGGFEEVPGIIVSAGPSLEKNIHILREAQNKALLIATAPTVRVLLAYDIRPDFLVSVDHAEGNRIHFEGLWDGAGIALLFPMGLATSIVRDFQGKMFAMQNDKPFLSQDWDPKGDIRISGNVAGWALKAAIAFGCDPIIFVGQDLSYSDKTHIIGSARSRPFSMQNHAEDFRWVPGLYGKQVLTSNRFLSFLADIESIILQEKRTFINSSAHGVHIRGTEVLPLSEALAKYCSTPIDRGMIDSHTYPSGRINFPALIRDTEKAIEELGLVAQKVFLGIKNYRNIGKFFEKDGMITPYVAKMAERNIEILNSLKNFLDSFPLLSISLAKEISLSFQEEYTLQENLDPMENMKIFLRRNYLLLPAAHHQIRRLQGLFRDLLNTLRKMAKRMVAVEQEAGNGMNHLALGKVLAEVGLHREAIEAFKIAINLEADQSSINWELANSYVRIEKLGKARECLARADERTKNSAKVKRSLDQIEQLFRGWLEKAESDLEEGNWINALLYVRKALREDPHCERALRVRERGLTLRQEEIDQAEKAQREEKRERERLGHLRGLLDQGKEAIQREDYCAAIPLFQQALECSSQDPEVKNLLACCYSETGNFQQAKKILEELSAKDPDSGLYVFNLARVLCRQGDWKRATENLEKAAMREEKYHIALVEAGSIYSKNKEYEKALSCYAKYLVWHPHSIEILNKVGTCFLAKGWVEKAKEQFQKVLAICPDYLPAQMGTQKAKEMAEHNPPPKLGPESQMSREENHGPL